MNYAKCAKYVFLVLFMTSTFTHAEDINSGIKPVIDIANTTIQLGISDLKKQYKDDLEILYEDMSRKGQLNGTSMLGRLSKLCLNEIDDCALLIHNTLLRVVKDSGVSYSDELTAELKNIVKSHLTGEIGNISGYIKQRNKFGPTLTSQLSIKETELNNKRTNELKKINSEIDLLAISLKNQEKEAVKTGRVSNKFINWLQTNWVVSLISFISALLGILGFFGWRQKINISSPTVISGDVKGDVVGRDKIQGDKVFGDKNVYQGQKPDTSLVSYFQDALSIMPELLMDMARALKDEKTKLIREFFVLRNRHVKIGIPTKPRLIYFEEDYENLQNKLDILEDYGFITDVRVGNAPIYRMTPELVQFLLTDIEIT